jgi:hypothetical protein
MSTTSTLTPARAISTAAERPAMPAPTMIASRDGAGGGGACAAIAAATKKPASAVTISARVTRATSIPIRRSLLQARPLASRGTRVECLSASRHGDGVECE